MTMKVTLIVIGAELMLTLLATAAFVIGYAALSDWARSPLGRHLMAFAAVGMLDYAALLCVAFGVPLPLWTYVVAYGLTAAVAVQRLWIFVLVQLEVRRVRANGGIITERELDHDER